MVTTKSKGREGEQTRTGNITQAEGTAVLEYHRISPASEEIE